MSPTWAECNVLIKTADLVNDLERFAFVDGECFDMPYHVPRFHRWITMKPRTCKHGYLAYFGKELIGYALVEQHDDAVELFRIAVLPHHQHRGVGRKLVHWIEGLCVTPLVCNVCEDYLLLQQFLRSCGMRARRPKQGENVYVFESVAVAMEGEK